MKAKEKGAKIIHVDPRFTRTSSIADIYARIRPGADIAYLGAIINYILQNKLYDEEYVEAEHERAPPREGRVRLRGRPLHRLRRGEAQVRQRLVGLRARREDARRRRRRRASTTRAACSRSSRQHFARYTFEEAREISGIPAEQIKLIADTFVEQPAGHDPVRARDDPAHDRRAGHPLLRIMQLLLGNIGVAGGGVNALRGEPNVQGACDMSVLYNYFAGYTAQPDHDQPDARGLREEVRHVPREVRRERAQGVVRRRRHAGERLRVRLADEEERRRRTTPSSGCSRTRYAGKVKFLYVMGQNPMVTNPNLNYVHEALVEARDARRPGPLGDRDGGVLAAPGRRPEGDPDRGASSSPPPTSWRRRARSPAPAAWCSGGTRR